MIRVVFFICLIGSTACIAQSSIGGYIFDKSTNKPLPYATIKLIKSETYTITNEDGKFEIKDKYATDSLEVTYIGYNYRKVPLLYFEKNSKLFLSPNIFELKEVLVQADKNYVYNLLNSLIQKYRKKQTIIESKAFLTLTSSARNIPIEQVEGFYNSRQSSSDGIIDLKIKSGRFGQNKSFPFYSLNNTFILSDFQFFKNSNQILPFYPGNMSSNTIKRKYIVKIDECNNCNKEDMLISFTPRKSNGRFFYGKILFNNVQLIIKKIELTIKDPITKELSSINKNVVITPKEIQLNIVFNPTDFEKLQYLDFTFILNYHSLSANEIINSRSFLYFYDYNDPFEEPYFTTSINFNNDYDKIIALQATNAFWKTNYQFPKSFNEKRSMDFMKKYGYLINYENSIPLNDLKYTKPSVISWSKNKRLEWKNIKQVLTSKKNAINPINRNLGEEMMADKVFHSSSEITRNIFSWDSNKKFNFSYVLDQYENINGDRQIVSRTLFDINSSFFKYNRTKNKLVYINLVFDTYEYYRQILSSQITTKMTFNEVKQLSKEKFEEASVIIEKMSLETNFGENFQNLIRWNNKIKSNMNIDNFSLVN